MRALGFRPDVPLDQKLFDEYNLSPAQRHGVTPVITGCHVTDGEWSLLFLEGPYEETVRPFLESEAVRQCVEAQQATILAPAEDIIGLKMKYSVRLWMQLQAKLYHLQLRESVRSLMCKSSTYAKSKVLKGAFEGLCILKEVYY
jgi:hypothetical protein